MNKVLCKVSPEENKIAVRVFVVYPHYGLNHFNVTLRGLLVTTFVIIYGTFRYTYR